MIRVTTPWKVLAVMPPYEVSRLQGPYGFLPPPPPEGSGSWIGNPRRTFSTISGSFIGFLAMWEVENLSLAVALSTDVGGSV